MLLLAKDVQLKANITQEVVDGIETANHEIADFVQQYLLTNGPITDIVDVSIETAYKRLVNLTLQIFDTLVGKSSTVNRAVAVLNDSLNRVVTAYQQRFEIVSPLI